MRRLLAIALVAVVAPTLGVAVPARAEFEGRPLIDNASIPTGYTLNRGEVVLGFGPLGVGISNNVQVSTNVLLWAAQVYNADLKISTIKTDHVGVAIGARWTRVPMDFADEEDVPYRALAPYVSISPHIGQNTLAHVGARMAIFDDPDGNHSVEEAKATFTNLGSAVFAGIEHGVSERTRLLGDVTYDKTFDTYRVSGGAVFGWQTFRLKLGLHYITEDEGTFVPMIGFRWRFNG